MIRLLAQTDIKLNVNVPKASLDSALVKSVDLLIYAAGALSVIFILVGAFFYVISGGNSDATRKAKDTIMYALIGLAVSSAAYAIVKYVVKSAS